MQTIFMLILLLFRVTNSEISAYAEHILEVNVGPEVLTGSTRLKSGTAQNSY